MYLHLDYQSGEAIYRQIVEQIKYKIASGELKPTEQLPSIRELAKMLKINPRTVVKAYEELQSGGLVVRRQGQGVFIRDGQAAVPVQTRNKLLQEMARRMLAEASRLGASEEQVKDVFDNVMKQMRSGK
ncbi:MAG: GntR family transcriptional regulator [Sedimentisphaerales bacterium]|nr:GntR family transcriptional regulator [Sedimentisphaerales bacterium]